MTYRVTVGLLAVGVLAAGKGKIIMTVKLDEDALKCIMSFSVAGTSLVDIFIWGVM